MKHRLLLTACFLSLVTSSALAQGAPDDPATKDDILRLFEVMQIRQQMRPMMDSILQGQSDLAHQTIRRRYPQASAAKIAEFDRVMNETMKDFPVDAMLDDMIPVYTRHLTRGDVDAMSKFYSSPTGQKMLHEMPAMTSEAMQAAYKRMETHMDELMRKMEQMEKEDQKPKSPAPKKQPQPDPQAPHS